MGGMALEIPLCSMCVLLGFICVSGGWKEASGVKCIIYPWISDSCVLLARRMSMLTFTKSIYIMVWVSKA